VEAEMDSSKHELRENLKKVVDSAAKAASDIGTDVVRSAEKLVNEARQLSRQTVISVRLDAESAQRLGQLIEVGICRTRSEAVAYLTREGIKARQELFRRIDEKIGEIQRIRESLKDL
jgi:hypothetical protein